MKWFLCYIFIVDFIWGIIDFEKLEILEEFNVVFEEDVFVSRLNKDYLIKVVFVFIVFYCFLVFFIGKFEFYGKIKS